MSKRPAKVRRLRKNAEQEVMEQDLDITNIPERNELCLAGESETSGTPQSDMDLRGMLEEARAEIVALRTQLVSTQSHEPVSNVDRTVNWSIFKDDRLIPEFRPSDLSQNIDEWLQKVNDYGQMYHWDEVTKIYIALGKLRGTAKLWYDGLKSTKFTWAQWEKMLKEMFPSKTTFGQLFYEAAIYQASPGQDLNDYCFHKLAKLNKLELNLSQSQIVDCIIEGIKD